MIPAAAGREDCFVAGTMIATTRGHVPVEAIRPGERVCTVLHGDTAEVIWVGHRLVRCGRHPEPARVWPVRVAADAFGRGMPAADLLLSPDHALFVENRLIPVRLLVNGFTVRQELTERVRYHHLELSRHDVVLANGMPAESYLAGDRTRFSNAGGVVTLHPDFFEPDMKNGLCAPLALSGPVLAAARKRLAVEVARRRRRVREALAPGNHRPS